MATTTYRVARVEDLPMGERQLVQVGKLEIAVFNVGGDYYALPNVCTHQWGPVCRGRISGTVVASAETGWRRAWVREGTVLICPWHSMEFDITNGQCIGFPNVRLRQYPVHVEDDGWITLTLGRGSEQSAAVETGQLQ